ncbi:MAG TPA: AraC family transcriptional regulator [Thermoanaerobaculia bacterium]
MTMIALASTSRPDTIQAHRRAVDRVIHAMYQNLAREFSLKDMASVALISPYHFNRVFHQVAGMPPCQFLSALRLWQAKRLLVTTQLKVTDICFEVGYNSLGTFTRRFTDLVGVPPQRLRALARSGGIEPLLRGLGSGLAAVDQVGPNSLHGKVKAPEGFRGPVFLGLFASPLPQGRPLACTVLAQPGPFQISYLPDGTFHLFAAAVDPEAQDAAELLLLERALRGTLRRAVKVRNGVAAAPVEVTLRPPEPIDPPILLTFPLLLAERLASPPLAGACSTAVH